MLRLEDNKFATLRLYQKNIIKKVETSFGRRENVWNLLLSK